MQQTSSMWDNQHHKCKKKNMRIVVSCMKNETKKIVLHTHESWITIEEKEKKSWNIGYKDVVDLVETKNYIDISDLEETNDEHEVDLDANPIQHIMEQYPKLKWQRYRLWRGRNQHWT